MFFKNVKNNSNKPLKEGIKCLFLSSVVIDYVFKSGKSYFPQTVLEECKHKLKDKEKISLIKDDL